MADPKRLQLSRRRGWRLPPNAVVVSRPSKFGNPFTIEQHGAAVAVELFAVHLALDRDLQRAARVELEGRDLACWCPIGEPCHGDVLLAFANGPDEVFAADGGAVGELVRRVFATIRGQAA